MERYHSHPRFEAKCGTLHRSNFVTGRWTGFPSAKSNMFFSCGLETQRRRTKVLCEVCIRVTWMSVYLHAAPMRRTEATQRLKRVLIQKYEARPPRALNTSPSMSTTPSMLKRSLLHRHADQQAVRSPHRSQSIFDQDAYASLCGLHSGCPLRRAPRVVTGGCTTVPWSR